MRDSDRLLLYDGRHSRGTVAKGVSRRNSAWFICRKEAPDQTGQKLDHELRRREVRNAVKPSIRGNRGQNVRPSRRDR